MLDNYIHAECLEHKVLISVFYSETHLKKLKYLGG